MKTHATLYIAGAGGHGKVVAEVAQDCGFANILFTPEHWPGNLAPSKAEVPFDAPVFIAIGENHKRLHLVRQLLASGYHLPILVHPTAFVSRNALLAAGTVVMPQVAINAGTVIGVGAIINTGASVDHDCKIGDGVHISPGARLAGTITVGEESWIGIGAVVREGIHIGAKVMVGAASAVVSDIPDGVRVVGVPAKKVR